MTFMMRKLWALFVVFTLLLPGAAMADVVYTTANGTLGRIFLDEDDNVSVSSCASGLGQDAFVFTWNKGTRRVAVVKRQDTNLTRLIIYTSEKWTEPAEYTLAGASGVRALDVSNNDRSLFAACYDGGSIDEFSIAQNYEPTGRIYVDGLYAAPLTDRTFHAEKVLIRNDTLYGLFSSVSNSGSYYPSHLVALDGFLDVKTMYTSFDVGPNAVDMSFINNGQLAVAYLGGPQGAGMKGGIDLLRSGKITSIVSGDAYGGVRAVCGDSDNGLYFLSQKYNDDTPVNTLYRWQSDVEVEPLGFSGSGDDPQLVWDRVDKLLYMMTEDGIQVIDNSGVRMKALSNAELGGEPTSMAYLEKADTRDNNSSNGCGAFGAPAFLCLLIPLLFKKRGCQ